MVLKPRNMLKCVVHLGLHWLFLVLMVFGPGGILKCVV
jgi:hypothetical protein